MSLKVRTRKVDGVVVIDLYGRITCGEPRLLLRDTLRRFTDDGNTRFVLNLSDVSFVDSAGLAELVSTKILLKEYAGQVNLLGLTKKVHDLLVITKLAVVFAIFDEESKAIAALQCNRCLWSVRAGA